MIKIYHNPACSKSRACLALVQAEAQRHGLVLEIVEYLKHPPTLEELHELWRQLGDDAQLIARDHEAGSASPAELLAAIARQPHLLQRPLVSYGGQARIGRPPECVLTLFSHLNRL